MHYITIKVDYQEDRTILKVNATNGRVSKSRTKTWQNLKEKSRQIHNYIWRQHSFLSNRPGKNHQRYRSNTWHKWLASCMEMCV